MQIISHNSLILTISLIVLISGCKGDRPDGEPTEKTVDLAEYKETSIPESRSISYEMTLPVEMAGLFDHVGADFYPEKAVQGP